MKYSFLLLQRIRVFVGSTDNLWRTRTTSFLGYIDEVIIPRAGEQLQEVFLPVLFGTLKGLKRDLKGAEMGVREVARRRSANRRTAKSSRWGCSAI
jgi:hypothetical protein